MSPGSGPDLIVVGERVALGPLRRDLAETYARWVNHADVRYGLEHLGIATPQTEEAWIDDMTKEAAEREPKSAPFTIYDRGDGAPIGTVTLVNISYLHGSATLGIMLGERRGQGLGTEATRLALDWAFFTLGLTNVMLEALAWNAQAVRAYEKAGFRHIGIRRQAALCRGVHDDVVLMDALRDDVERLRP